MKSKLGKYQPRLPNLYMVGMISLIQRRRCILSLTMLPTGLENEEEEVLFFVLLNNVTISKSDWLGEPKVTA